jgi:hypothetical protein
MSAGIRKWAFRHRAHIQATGRLGHAFERRLVWLFGAPRSGTTWLMSLLVEHQQITGINEPLIGDHLGPFLSDQPAIRSDLDLDSFTPIRYWRGEPKYFFSRDFEHVWLPLLGDLMRSRLFAQVRAQRGTTRGRRPLVVVKEPRACHVADVVMAALPRSRMLLLLRDGRDVIDSELAALTPGSWAVEDFSIVRGVGPADRLDFVTDCAHKWLWRMEAAEEAYAAHEGPKRVVRYEELLRDPATQLRGLFGWLGVEIQDEEIDRFVDKHAFEHVEPDRRGPDSFWRAATPGMWRENLSEAEQAKIARLIGPKLRQLGYSTEP